MIHELLLACNGCDGDIFVLKKDTGMIEVADELPFVHPSEVQLMNKICCLGTYYHRLHTFVEQQQTAENGLYVKAVACGVDELLDAYRRTLLRIEEEAYSDPHMPLTHVREQLDEYQLVLPRVSHVISTTQQNKWRGGHILSYIYDQCNSGDPFLRHTFQRLLHVCHKVMYQQSSAWMLHGLLLDHKEEFFVESVTVTELPSSPSDEEPPSNETTVAVGGSPLSSYHLRSAMLPSYLPVRVAEKILFIGEAAQIFNFTDKTLKVPNKNGHERMLLARPDELRLASMLAHLQQQPVFSVQQFETAVDSIRTCVAERLWKLIVEDSDLIGHLHILKDFFLLGRGELFQTFVDMVQSLLREPVTATTEHDVNAAFKQASYKVGVDEEISQHFSLTCPAPSSTSKAHKSAQQSHPVKHHESGWSKLGLSYHVRWPLHTLFTPSILHQYNVLFGFLINIRQVQVMLQHCWALQMMHKGSGDRLAPVWQLRSHMAFLIDKIQYYVQVDVIESQFSLLLENIRSTHDFETIQQAHCNFVSSLYRQLFLQATSILHLLNEILQLCISFCLLVMAGLQENTTPELDRISKEFNRKSSEFLRRLSDVRDHQDNPHLAQLLLCVDYNRFFETTRATLPSHATEATN
ncbi:gamma-tubulin complex component 4-like [Dysidea avara]|uniref:gamma-tubulin complex component 4-like n=1 Tax=Dysidea avara TaxID=196820 RepID=UPI003317AE46